MEKRESTLSLKVTPAAQSSALGLKSHEDNFGFSIPACFSRFTRASYASDARVLIEECACPSTRTRDRENAGIRRPRPPAARTRNQDAKEGGCPRRGFFAASRGSARVAA
jgi:hypothetical protein